MTKLLRTAAFLLYTALTTPVVAQDFDAGVLAYDAGDFATALEHWLPLAEQGEAKAQYNYGIIYANGLGVLQDAVLAHMWHNISGANGGTVGPENRSIIELEMTREQIADAQARARVCMSSNYQDCN